MNHSNPVFRRKIYSFCKWLLAVLLLENMVFAVIFLKISRHWQLFCLLVFGIAFIVVVLALWKIIVLPMIGLEEKLMQMYEKIPQRQQIENQEEASLTQILEDVISYQEQLINKDLLSKYLLKESELSALQSQINPHFLFNTLESIRGCAYRQGMPELARITEAMSSLFRNSIQQGGKLLPLREELDNINNYMMIQQFRFPEKFEFQVHIEESNLLNFQVPNMVIQPIVENAIFHGLETKVEKGKIDLYISSTRKRLIIRVVDDGVGISARKLAKLQNQLTTEKPTEGWRSEEGTHEDGIGILNIHKRIQLRFGEQYGITIASTIDVGTEVEITLPIVLEE